jgi:chromosome segregation ATPase
MSAGSGSDDMRELRRQRDEAERQRDALRESEGRWQDIARAEHLEVERLRKRLVEWEGKEQAARNAQAAEIGRRQKAEAEVERLRDEKSPEYTDTRLMRALQEVERLRVELTKEMNEIAQLRAALAKEYDQRIELMWERDAFKAALGKTVDHLRFNTWCEDPNNTRRIAAVNEARQVLEGVNDA